MNKREIKKAIVAIDRAKVELSEAYRVFYQAEMDKEVALQVVENCKDALAGMLSKKSIPVANKGRLYSLENGELVIRAVVEVK